MYLCKCAGIYLNITAELQGWVRNTHTEVYWNFTPELRWRVNKWRFFIVFINPRFPSMLCFSAFLCSSHPPTSQCNRSRYSKKHICEQSRQSVSEPFPIIQSVMNACWRYWCWLTGCFKEGIYVWGYFKSINTKHFFLCYA
jgi:hypothetical protein